MHAAALKPRTRSTLRFASAVCTASFVSATALAQGAPPTAGFPAGDPAAAPTEPAAAPPEAAPPPAPPQSGPPPVQYAPAQQPGPAPQGYATAAPPPESAPPEYSPPPRAPARISDVEEPLPPPPPEEHHGFKMPPWSVRIDPFTWLLEGRLGLEMEVGVLKWLSVELVPVFVTATKPVVLTGFSSRDDEISQHSNGLGPISGTSIGLGFWLDGRVLHGYFIRAIFTNYGYKYTSPAGQGTNTAGDTVNFAGDSHVHTDRVLEGMFGSNATWGPFTIGGGIGLGVDLNHEVRCAPMMTGESVPPDPGCNSIELRTAHTVSTVSSFTYPIVIDGRISLGVTFD